MADLLADCAVQAGIATVNTGDILAFFMGRVHGLHDLLQVQFSAVYHGLGLVSFEHCCGHQGAGVDDHWALTDQTLPFDRDQFRVARAGADEVDRHGKSLQVNGCSNYPPQARARVAAPSVCRVTTSAALPRS
ncbi:hypothetical protein D3C81_1679870 [compost metagenome]